MEKFSDYKCQIVGKNAYVSGKNVGRVFVATSSDGRITVVGIRSVVFKTASLSSLEHTEGGYHTQVLLNPGQKMFQFSLGHAIRHANDKNDPEFAVHLAIKRAVNEHRFLSSNSYSMLGNDRCQAIVEDELAYILIHLDEYLDEYKGDI